MNKKHLLRKESSVHCHSVVIQNQSDCLIEISFVGHNILHFGAAEGELVIGARVPGCGAGCG